MFQDFSAPRPPQPGDDRLARLRTAMADAAIDWLLVPHDDEQRNEYLPPNGERLAYATGFTGSAGEALIGRERGLLFVDGRYTLQAAEQTGAAGWEVVDLVSMPPHRWIGQNAAESDRIGFDPWLHSASAAKRLETACKDAGAAPVTLDANLVDAIWQDRPAPPRAPVAIHDLAFAGKTTREKLLDVSAALQANRADACVLTDPASVCWLFNIRGGDVAHTPLALGHAILRRDDHPVLLLDPVKLDMEVRAYLTQVADLRPADDLHAAIATASAEGARVMLDPDHAPLAIHRIVRQAGGTVIEAADPCRLPRAQKNLTELAGARAAHLRDGLAMCRFLAWLDDQAPGSIGEIEAAKALEAARTEVGRASNEGRPLRDISFDTISGSGPNGAIVHYRVTEATDRHLQDGELYLVDSGGQYDDGTTDVTRTVAIGEPSREQRRAFTQVLRGHIAISRARFPAGTRGVDLDAFARMALWKAGRDYAHGTGHGVGSFLSVHEGPQSISRRGQQALLPGMIVSNEPGYYRAGEWGIRIENLEIVTEAEDIAGGDTPMQGFETLTLVPIDHRLVDIGQLDDGELNWLNAYHAHVWLTLEPHLDGDVRAWLRAATRPLAKPSEEIA